MPMRAWIQELTLLAVFLTPLTDVPRSSAEQKKPEIETVQQPLLFSHKQHCSIGIDCSLCHQTTGGDEEMGLPIVAACMNCHQTIKTDSPAVKTLASYYEKRMEIPWSRLSKVPAFVFFSHKKH